MAKTHILAKTHVDWLILVLARWNFVMKFCGSNTVNNQLLGPQVDHIGSNTCRVQTFLKRLDMTF